jgi:hypothetical protein
MADMDKTMSMSEMANVLSFVTFNSVRPFSVLQSTGRKKK